MKSSLQENLRKNHTTILRGIDKNKKKELNFMKLKLKVELPEDRVTCYTETYLQTDQELLTEIKVLSPL